MKTERIRTELSGAIFVSIFFTEVETNTETPKTKTKNKFRKQTDEYGTNTEHKPDIYLNQRTPLIM